MQLPADFKNEIKNKFYDKEFSVYADETPVDTVGWAKKKTLSVVSTFLGNARFDHLDKLQEQYGITEVLSMAITTDENIELETIIGYIARQHKVVAAIPFDSHYLLLTTKWLSRSSISTSV